MPICPLHFDPLSKNILRSVNSTPCVLLFIMCQYDGLAFKRTRLRQAPAGRLPFRLEFLTGNFFDLFAFFSYYSQSYEEILMASTSRIRSCKKFKRLYSFQLSAAIIVALTSVIFLSEQAYSAQATVAWNAETGAVAGYMVYWGPASRIYTNEANAGDNTTYTIPNLAFRTYYVAITAYNSKHVQSGFSPELVIEALSASAGWDGSISPAGSFFLTREASQTFTITPATGYGVSSVLVDGTSVGAVTSYTLHNITASHSILATFASVPSAPTGVTAKAHNAQATVSFKWPASNGGSKITRFTATSNPGGLTGTGVGSPITVSTLINGTTYTFTVTATNIIGTGPASTASNPVTPP